LPAEVEVTNAERVYDQLYAALILGATVIIADFTATIFCDSAGLHRRIMIHKWAAARNAQLRLVVPPGGSVRHVLELLGLDQPTAPGLLHNRRSDQPARGCRTRTAISLQPTA